MKRARKTIINHRGFTMIEVVVVLILLAILVSTVAIRFSSINSDIPNQIEILKSSLRFAQIKALNDTVDTEKWGIYFQNNYSYTLVFTKDGVTTSPVNLPGECGNNPLGCTQTPTHTLPSGMTISTGVGTTVAFDRWGSPGTSSISIALSKGSEPPGAITITKNTGYIQ